jgi:hypothetical protein
MSFVTVSAETFAATFTKAGFAPTTAYNEVVYERAHTADPRFVVRVYTSLSLGASVARGNGADAIRACLVFRDPITGKTRGMGKTVRVNRTGTEAGVMERSLERAREMWNLASGYVAQAKRNSAIYNVKP